jgi:glucose-6-phosphate 1-dehydrogenase
LTAQAIVIIGATGDLAQRMLYPSLYFLDSEGSLPADFRIIGASRGDLIDEAFIDRVEKSVRERAEGYFSVEAFDHFRKRLSYRVVDADRPATFQNLAAPLAGAHEVIF